MLRLTIVISLLKLIQSTSMHETRVSSSGNMSKTSRLNLNQDSFSKFEELNFGTKFLTNFVNSPKELLRNIFHDFLPSKMEAEDDYVEVPILLQKMTSSAALTKCTNN